WITQSEDNVLGYNVYRNTNFNQIEAVRINSEIIQALNQTVQHVYTCADNNVPITPTCYYWLECIDLDGTTEFFGPVVVSLNSFYLNMLDCQAEVQDYRKVRLNWITEDESNELIGFDIYRSPVRNYSSAVKINPQIVNSANAVNQFTYSFTDDDILIGEL
ncbi:MAG TPA: hypothetical protein P5280_18320, partial [Cyclobacteriaceae bacterium]|nr:hypothetical protein [Cyclobacteriaceae bacterium]